MEIHRPATSQSSFFPHELYFCLGATEITHATGATCRGATAATQWVVG